MKSLLSTSRIIASALVFYALQKVRRKKVYCFFEPREDGDYCHEMRFGSVREAKTFCSVRGYRLGGVMCFNLPAGSWVCSAFLSLLRSHEGTR